MEGWIKLHRKSLNSSVMRNPKTWFVWCWCLIKACHKSQKFPFNGKDVELKAGQFITGRSKAIEELNITPMSYRVALKYLKTTSRITIKTTNKFSIISICNWKKYQGKTTSRITSRITSQQPANNQPTTTYKNDKKVKNDKNINTYMSLFNKLFERKFRPTKGRIRKLELRLKSYTLKEILKALNNLSQSPFYRGVNDRGWEADPDFLLRSDEQVDKFLNMNLEQAKQLSRLNREAKHGNKIAGF